MPTLFPRSGVSRPLSSGGRGNGCNADTFRGSSASAVLKRCATISISSDALECVYGGTLSAPTLSRLTGGDTGLTFRDLLLHTKARRGLPGRYSASIRTRFTNVRTRLRRICWPASATDRATSVAPPQHCATGRNGCRHRLDPEAFFCSDSDVAEAEQDHRAIAGIRYSAT